MSGDLHTDANEAIADSGVEQVTKLVGAFFFFFFAHRVLVFLCCSLGSTRISSRACISSDVPT